MNGLLRIKQLTGDYPVYPGHPLVVAVQIMRAFPSIVSASAPTQYGWPEALADSEIAGAGCHVSAGLRVLQRGASGATVEDMIRQADRYWTEGHAGGHVKNVANGTAQAKAVEPYFRKLVEPWLATAPLPSIERLLHNDGRGAGSMHEPN